MQCEIVGRIWEPTKRKNVHGTTRKFRDQLIVLMVNLEIDI